MRNEKFENLPAEIREDIKSICKVYREAYVTYYNGKYHASACIGIQSSYPADHRYVGDYKAEEVYTEDERIENYVNCFYSYPTAYKGKKDWELLKTLENDRQFDFDKMTCTCWVAGLVNGNIELVGKRTYNL